MAVSDRFPGQEDEAEGDFGISALFSDHHEVEKAAETVTSPVAEHADEFQRQEVLDDCTPISLLQATSLPTERFHSETDGYNLPQLYPGGESGSSSTKDQQKGFCGICAEKRQMSEMMRVSKTCPHSFCSNCISSHVSITIAGNQATVPCLELHCEHSVEFQSCVGILPRDVLDAWGRKLCEALIPIAHKLYCPFRDCSAMLVNDCEKLVEECECPHCNRLFCVQCRVPWHSGVSCQEFQELNEDERDSEDIMLWKLAQNNKWARCPNCRFYVERTEGCPHMNCRCGYEFCYGCNLQWSDDHGGCSRS
ncbi:hypothetical protein SAY87_022054 [Trapa incisa]|uniref:RBR-type E3 ubiquitin transferase n=1 Tax=Trapa incisa TaxID=236973 RepID=A0AAN7PSV8_9MYRT|nr:hypothetical protein SAY87_022054 [Trapa incisa]